MFGQPDLTLDRERGGAAARTAAAAGITLPAAVAEWYCVPESSPVWRAFSRHDEPLLHGREGEPSSSWFGRPIRDDATNTWWSVPTVCHDLRGWVPEPILPLMGESVGSWWWGVVLDGSADSRTVITHDEGETWDVCGVSFSSFVYATLFDAVFEDPFGHSREVRLEGHHLYGPGRQRMLEQFRIEPASRVPYAHNSELTERYSREGQRVSVSNLEMPVGSRYRPDSHWRLWAANWEEFHDLVGRLCRVVPAFAGLTPMRGDPLWIAPGFTAGGSQLPEPERGESDIPF